MAYTNADNKIGVPDVSVVSTSGTLGAPWVSTTNVLPSVSVEVKPGTMMTAQDNTLGEATFILLAVPVSTTITVGLLYQWDKNYTVVLVPVAGTSKNTGVAVALAYTAVTSNANSVQYAWFLVRGQAATLKTAVAASPQSAVYISATAGRVKFVSSTGQQILGARTQNTATISAGASTVNVYYNFSALEGA
jgi:hypothetical protein